MARIIHFTALTLVTACWLSSVGCSSSNDPATPGSGNTGNTGNTAGTGTVPQGGTGGTADGTAGSTTIAGTSGTVGGSGGGVAAGGGSGGTFTPLCAGLTTAAIGSPAPTKAGACTATDPQLCYKTCGPASTGFKSETCTNGAYVEQSGCTFPPDLDASCYKIPAAVDPSCPAMPPQASQPCTVNTCTLCSVGGAYLDSTGASKVGYCVCPAPGASGTSKWSCASSTAWPCPAGNGC